MASRNLVWLAETEEWMFETHSETEEREEAEEKERQKVKLEESPISSLEERVKYVAEVGGEASTEKLRSRIMEEVAKRRKILMEKDLEERRVKTMSMSMSKPVKTMSMSMSKPHARKKGKKRERIQQPEASEDEWSPRTARAVQAIRGLFLFNEETFWSIRKRHARQAYEERQYKAEIAQQLAEEEERNADRRVLEEEEEKRNLAFQESATSASASSAECLGVVLERMSGTRRGLT